MTVYVVLIQDPMGLCAPMGVCDSLTVACREIQKHERTDDAPNLIPAPVRGWWHHSSRELGVVYKVYEMYLHTEVA